MLAQGCTEAFAFNQKALPVGVFHCQNLVNVFKKGDRCAQISDRLEGTLLTIWHLDMPKIHLLLLFAYSLIRSQDRAVLIFCVCDNAGRIYGAAKER